MARLGIYGDLLLAEGERGPVSLPGWIHLVLRSTGAIQNTEQTGIEHHVFRTDGCFHSALADKGAGGLQEEVDLNLHEALLPKPLYKAFARIATCEQVHVNVIFDRSDSQEPMLIGMKSFDRPLRWSLDDIETGVAEMVNKLLGDD